MLLVISPAKSLDFQSPVSAELCCTQPVFLERAADLVTLLRDLSPADLARLMDISDQLAVLNVTRYAQWSTPFTVKNARPALFAFNGDVYEGLDARGLDAAALDYAQAHLRILSGLYGVLRPFDLMQAYRLEMGCRLKNQAGRDLYAFWGDTITDALAADLAAQPSGRVLVDLASEEYFKAVRPLRLGVRIVTPVFEERKGSAYRIVSFHAKRARGLMCRYASTHHVTQVEDLKSFDLEDYVFEPRVSDTDRWVFRRG